MATLQLADFCAVFASVVLLFMLAVRAGADDTNSGQWLQFRGDRALTGYSPLKGSITSPTVQWKQFVGSQESLFQILPVGKRNTVRSKTLEDVLSLWETTAEMLDLDGNGVLTEVPIDPFSKTGKFLSHVPGLQKLAFESGFESGGTSLDVNFPLFGRLYVREEGRWKQYWQSEPIPLLYVPLTVVDDIDGDGKLEVAVLPWYDVWVLDVETGRLKYKQRYVTDDSESGRAYGWVGAVDINNDGKKELVIASDFEARMSVLGFRNGNLELFWSKLIEHGVGNKRMVVAPGIDPVHDVDGDGICEITLSIFNQNGDEKWHIVVVNAITGEIKHDLADLRLMGLLDINTDNTWELLVSRTSGRLLTDASEVFVVSLAGGKVTKIWRQECSQFQSRFISRLPLSANLWAPYQRETRLVSGQLAPGEHPVFFTRRAEGLMDWRITCWQWQDGHLRELNSVSGPNAEAVAVQPNLGILISTQMLRARKAKLQSCAGFVSRELACSACGLPASPVVVGKLDPRSRPYVVAPSACNTVTAFQPPLDGKSAGKAWRVDGRGAAMGFHRTLTGGVTLADVTGSGGLAALVARDTLEGHARLSAVGPDGKDIWSADFPGFCGKSPFEIGGTGGLITWGVGNFTSRQHMDVSVALMRSTGHTEEMFLLDGQSGTVLWHRTNGTNAKGRGRACGGNCVAAHDHDGDGLDDIFLLWPDNVFVMKGCTGEPLLDISTDGLHYDDALFRKVWAFYAMPAVYDFLGNGKAQFLYGSSSYALGVITFDGEVAWWDGPSTGTPAILLGIGDADGDGRIEVFGPGFRRANKPGPKDQEMHCYDAATGKLKWKMDLPGECFGANVQVFPKSPVTPVTCDIDSDGRDECIFGIDNTLYAVSANSNGDGGEIKWTHVFPAKIGPAAIADIDGSETPQIVVACEDGYVYGIGPAPQSGSICGASIR